MLIKGGFSSEAIREDFLGFAMLQISPKLPFRAKLCEGVGVKNRTRKRAPEGRADLPSVPVQASGHKKY